MLLAQELAKGEQLVFLEGTAHCRDMRASKPDDPPAVQWAHANIRQLVARWLGANNAASDADDGYTVKRHNAPASSTVKTPAEPEEAPRVPLRQWVLNEM